MFGYGISQSKAMFFDRPAVMNATDRATQRVHSKIGAFIRQRAKTSIRKRKGVSAPGSPPSSHLDLIRDFIFFFWDARVRSVVIGPARLNGRAGDGRALAALEAGGASVLLDVDKRTGVTALKTIQVEARPFMAPARDAELPRLPKLWRNAVRK